jgi:hypothetical protein
MSRAYGEPVDVQARDDGRPTAFVWRSRRYTVRAILEHWVVRREPREPTGPSGLRHPSEPQVQATFEFWRVEASPGPGTAAGVYELRREAATGGWTLR